MLARRSILKVGLGVGVLSVAAGRAHAQFTDRSRDVVQAIATAKGQAENLLAVALYSNLSTENKPAIEAANERVSSALAAVLGGIPAEEAFLYAEPAQALVAEAMVEAGVPAIPETKTPVIAAESSASSGEGLIDVAADIFKDAFGVQDLNVSGLTQVVSELALLDSLNRVGALIQAGNWALAADFLRALLSQLAASAQALPTLQRVLGEDAVKAILSAVGARFAPFIGWPILIAAILFAVEKHRQRLLAALEKAR